MKFVSRIGTDVLETGSYSILERRVLKYGTSKLSEVNLDTQVVLYCETLVELSVYIDTGDTENLNNESMEKIKKDIKLIITELIRMQTNHPRFTKIKSIDGILQYLRLVRDDLRVAQGMLPDGPSKSKDAKFFTKLRTVKGNIDEALKSFKDELVSQSKVKIMKEMNKGS